MPQTAPRDHVTSAEPARAPTPRAPTGGPGGAVPGGLSGRLAPVPGHGPGGAPGSRRLPGGDPPGVPLRALRALRLAALAGQACALAVAELLLGLPVATPAALLVLLAAAAVDLWVLLAPRGRRLSPDEVALLLVFDVVQLALLLGLTGGLDNPFALLLLAPATIAATLLDDRRAALLGLLALGAILLLGILPAPLGPPEAPLSQPPLLRLGFGIALAIGVVFLGLYARRVTHERDAMAAALAAAERQLLRAERLADVSSLAAAAAHELGTPLATITLAAAEMEEELADRPGPLADARLIRAEALRARDILRGIGGGAGRAPGRDPFLDQAPAEAVLREAAEPHQARALARGLRLDVRAPPGPQPSLPRDPALIQGLRNLVGNAVDFARGRVELRLAWDAAGLVVEVADDGPGFPPGLPDRLGEPFLPSGHDGLGLGLFIAEALLARSGGRLALLDEPQGGACAAVTWPPEAARPKP